MMKTSTFSFNKTLPLFSLPKPFVTPDSKQNNALFFMKQFNCLYSDDAAVTSPHRQSRRRDGLEVRAVPARLGTLYPDKLVESVTVTITAELPFGKKIEDWLVQEKVFYLTLTDVDGKELGEYAYYIEIPDELEFSANFDIPEDFGEVGAVKITNEEKTEIYIKNIALGLRSGKSEITCNSWLHSKDDDPEPRVFFTNKSYLPSQTPKGLVKLRKDELLKLRGNGAEQEERKSFERIYDYDTYNDLGDPKTDLKLIRPILGGNEHPYPRRCRTGREQITIQGQTFETQLEKGSPYVPRDENFSQLKETQFRFKTIYSMLHAVIPTIKEKVFATPDSHFPFFTSIDLLYNEGINLPVNNDTSIDLLYNEDINLPVNNEQRVLGGGTLEWLHRIGGTLEWLHRIIKASVNLKFKILRFEPSDTFKRDRFSWLSDEEFARQTLASMNPLSIKRVTNWPLKSNLDPNIYGKPESALTTEVVEKQMNNITVEEAIKEKRLFIIDYHDALLPFVNKVRKLENTTLYGSRTLFFLDDEQQTLKPLAIELTRPPNDVKSEPWKEVFTPGTCATSEWLWKLAKVHVLAHDTGYHQLISHWLRTHCCTEPYIIAANRCLSAMHPIYKLLSPHFRYTMQINALARQKLINAEGIIETTFSPGKYSLELSSYLYDNAWRFDQEALPADLISRGMAVEDPLEPHGIKLVIDDYPYAKDGLDMWAIIKEWVTTYVNHYYPNPSVIESDKELQNWWTEVRTVGHGDKKDEPWWPNLKTSEDLIHIVTTIIWVASGHHSAVNFGQYANAGYFPNRPTTARTTMPTEDPVDDLKHFIENPEKTLLQCFPSQMQAATALAILDTLSTHSPDEEYLGTSLEPSWKEEPKIMEAFDRFDSKLKALEDEIDKRNANKDLKNRNGVGVLPYELLKRHSKRGVTGKGVPNSISI